MANAKHDYDDKEFYLRLQELAMQGYNDSEIADWLDLDETTFNRMKQGKYDGWSKEENERRSADICQVLTRGRKRILGALRGTYIRAALGKVKPKAKTIKYIEERCECGGDEDCPICGGVGRIVRSDKWVTLETESETAPNMQAIATLLYHYDKDWRKVERRQDDEAQDVPVDVKHGISIEDWINKELQAEEDESESEEETNQSGTEAEK